MKTFQVKARLLDNNKVGEYHYKITLEAPQIAKAALPGQFVMVRVDNGDTPLLRRPLGIHRVRARGPRSEAAVELLFGVVGPGTKILAQKKSGEYADIIGPLGNGFTFGPGARGFRPVLVAGGMGVAPLVFLAEKLRGSKALVLVGAKTKDHILCQEDFRKAGCEVKIATDDGSKGFKGYVSDLLKNTVCDTSDQRRTTIYACGPRPMLQAISYLAQAHRIPAQVSLEEHMACGIGACLGCAVNTRVGFKRVCKEGPVFNVEEILW